MQRAYSSWSPDLLRGRGGTFSRLLFGAAWLHAVVLERRTFIPQGWCKFYEITDGDLNAARDLIERMLDKGIVTVTEMDSF